MTGIVMLVDDDAATLETLGQMLDELQIRYQAVSSASECLAYLISDPQRYRAIIMDIHMPALRGTDAARWIKDGEEEALRNVPIIALTADPNYSEQDSIAPFGMNAVLLKPVTSRELETVLDQLARPHSDTD